MFKYFGTTVVNQNQILGKLAAILFRVFYFPASSIQIQILKYIKP